MLMKRRSVLAGGAALAALSVIRPSFAAGTGNIFVSTEKGNEVVVLDKAYNIIKRIATSKRPRDMQLTKAHDLLYVACGDDDVIDVIDVAKLEVVKKIATGASPETFALDEARHRLYVSNEEGSSLSVIDIDQGITVHEVPTGAEPEGVFVHEDGKSVYVTSEVGDLVHLGVQSGEYIQGAFWFDAGNTGDLIEFGPGEIALLKQASTGQHQVVDALMATQGDLAAVEKNVAERITALCRRFPAPA